MKKSKMKKAKQSIQTLYTPKMRSTTLPLQAIWFSLSFGSYGLLIWINSIFVEVHLKDVYTNALLFAVANLPGNVVSGAFMDKVGRKVMLSSSMVCAALCLACFAYYARDPDNQREESGMPVGQVGIVLSACAFQAFSISGWNTIDCMTGELFPTSNRSTGMGICTASGRIGAMVAQFVNGSLAEDPVRLLCVACGSLLFGAIAPCMLGEDRAKRPLEDGVENSNEDEEEEELLSGSYQSITPPPIV